MANSRLEQTVRSLGWKKLLSRAGALVVVVVAVYSYLVVRGKIAEIAFQLTPRELPRLELPEKRVFLSQGWEASDAEWFHHASQGTATLPIPYRWFLALEQPKSDPWLLWFGEEGLYTSNDHLARLGFIAGDGDDQRATETYPSQLPIGFATTPSQYFEGIDRRATAVGFTCAACHTGHFVHGDTEYVIEGGPATTDLGLLTQTLGVALAQTLLSSKMTVFDGRFERFARRVLGEDETTNNAPTREELREQLGKTIALLASSQDTIDVTEGYSRLDALNRIGNQVFATDLGRASNRVAIDAPVNYPHIWTTSWFDWVQYDGSIMQPLARNTGEALGVSAYVNLTAPVKSSRRPHTVPTGVDDAAPPGGTSRTRLASLGGVAPSLATASAPSPAAPSPSPATGAEPDPPATETPPDAAPEPPYGQRFASSVPIGGLAKMEALLAGPPPGPPTTLGGLQSPAWPDTLPAIDRDKATKGASLYAARCAQCHRPPLQSEEIRRFMKPIVYRRDGMPVATQERYLQLAIIPLKIIGTDPRQANVLATRSVDTTGLGLDTEVCTQAHRAPVRDPSYGSPLGFVRITDSPTLSFALALGAVIEETNDQWFRQSHVPDASRAVFEGKRPNCLQAGAGYKARPLNGVWATGPFLHNGSVPTLHALLSPVKERPRFVQLGNPRFDAQHVGVARDPAIDEQIHEAGDDRVPTYVDGIFILDTKVEGNWNTGHEFADEPRAGVIGPALSVTERENVIEYLKTL